MTSHNASYAKLSPIQGCFFDTRLHCAQFYVRGIWGADNVTYRHWRY